MRWGSRAKGWFVKGEEKEFEEAVGWVVGEEAEGEARSVTVYGRELRVPWAKGGVARFSFAELCEMALGPADYITVASNFVSSLFFSDVVAQSGCTLIGSKLFAAYSDFDGRAYPPVRLEERGEAAYYLAGLSL